jgi:hypothetical protein
MRRALAVLCLLALGAGTGAAAAGRGDAFRALHGLSGARVHRPDPRVEVRVYEPDVQVPEAFLSALAAAAEELETSLGTAGAPVVVQVGGASRSMAVAYNPGEDAVIFPRNGKARDHGLRDHDRLRHELFHAWVARTHPHLVTPEALDREEVRMVHEGAADFFAFLGDDNGVFGDRFMDEPGPLRSYRTALRFALVQGSHAKGNALTSYWIEKGWGLAELKQRLDDGCEEPACMVEDEDHAAFGLAQAPDVAVSVEGKPPSGTNRYRVADGAVLRLDSNAPLQARHGALGTQFTTRAGTAVPGWTFAPLEQGGSLRRFRLRPAPDAQPQKVIVRHLVGETVIGFDVLYLGRARR